MAREPWIVWTSELSPFGLKVVLLCRHAGLPFRVLPAGGSTIEQLQYSRRRARLVKGRLPLTWPEMSDDDEFPLVPFLFGPSGENLYDSTAIAEWLDRRLAPERRAIPQDPAARFVARLIDDYADEFGLYMVHHNRWKVSAHDNDAGERLARELGAAWWPLRPLVAGHFARRQVRRLPYLFSVAPAGFRIDGLPAALQPPAPAGFPPTHELLEGAFARLLAALDALLSKRPFVLGERLTLADAGLYGELGMNLGDPSANRWMLDSAPALHAWLERLHRGDETLVDAHGSLALDEALRPLLAEICRTYVALMQQNHAAVARRKAQGDGDFNERAFDRGHALYDGAIDGHPFRAVAKTFQAKVWRESVAAWRALPQAVRDGLERLLPDEHGLGD